MNMTECPTTPSTLTERYLTFSHFVNGYLTTACVAMGTWGNLQAFTSVNFASYDRNRGLALAISMMFLSFWDTVLLWCAFFYYGLKDLVDVKHIDFINRITPYMHGMSQIANTASIWCVVFITVQRYLATRDPFRTTRWLLQFTTSEIKEYAHPARTLGRHHRIMFSSFRGERRRRKSSLNLLLCPFYRQHYKWPFLISALAVIVNLPAFLEIKAVPCLRVAEQQIRFILRISELRRHPYYRLWYKVVFRMVVTSCGPNILILLLTVRTVMLLRGSNRSRRHLFQMSEFLIDLYDGKATLLTLVSVMLVTKFLLMRSFSFALDVFEQAVGFGYLIPWIIYFVDMSNFLILLNSATNSIIILRFSAWLQKRIAKRHTLRRERQVCGEQNGCFNSVERINVIHSSWQKLLFLTSHQVGPRILYAMLVANPTVFALFKDVTTASQNGTPLVANHSYRGKRKVVRISSSVRLESLSTEPDATDSPTRLELPDNLDAVDDPFRDATDSSPLASTPPTAPLSAEEETRRKNMELLSNRKFRDIGDRIGEFLGELVNDMHAGRTEAMILSKVRKVGDWHYERGIIIPPTAWRDFKLAVLQMLGECVFDNEKEKTLATEAWTSFLAMFIREMKLAMVGSAGDPHQLTHKHSSSTLLTVERSPAP